MKKSALFIVLALVFLEWLDFSLYLYLAKTIFAEQFFSPTSYSLMLSFALFAAAYLARPLGGWLFGRQADLKGRRNPMMFSAALMGFATLGICLLPGYSQIGIWATWGLLACRIGQGLALGGEVITSAMFLVEHHPHKPLLAGSLVATSGAIGMFVGGATAAFLQYSAIEGAWRIVFAMVALFSLAVCRLRKGLHESPEFQARHWSRKSLINDWRGLLNIAIIAAFVSVTVYICNAFWVSFAIDIGFMNKIRCTWTGAFAQLASALLAFPIAYFAKPQQAYRLLCLSMITAGFAAPALFYFTLHHQELGVLTCLLGYIIANGLLCSSMYYFLYQQLPTQYRCRGVSTVWGLTASLGAISLPFAEQAIKINLFWFPGFLVAFVALSSLIFLNRYSVVETPNKNNIYAI